MANDIETQAKAIIGDILHEIDRFVGGRDVHSVSLGKTLAIMQVKAVIESLERLKLDLKPFITIDMQITHYQQILKRLNEME